MVKFIFIITILFTSLHINAFTLSPKTVIKKSNHEVQAEELSSYLEQILSHKIKIIKKLSNKSSVITLTTAPNKRLKYKKEESFIIESDQNRITISANSDRGLLYGVYHFLENYLGCKFLSPKYEYIPHFSSKKLDSNIVDIQEPAFEYREIFIAEADDSIYSTKCKLNGYLGHKALLTKQNNIFTEGINIDSLSSAQLIDDEYSCNGQFNFANTQVQQNAINKLSDELKNINKNRENYISLQHEDRDSFCQEGLKKGEFPSKTFSQYTQFIASKFPKNKFLSQAYLWSKQAPDKAIKFPDNLGIFFSPIEANFAKPLNSSENNHLFKNLKSWKNITNNIFLWHYSTNFGGYMLPFPNLYALDQDIKEVAKIENINGLFIQGSYSSLGGELANLRIWVFSKLLWNPNEDIEYLIKTFCDFYYKDSSKDAQLYIKTLHNFIKKSGDKLSFKAPINSKYLNEKNIEKLDQILKNGLKKTIPSSIGEKHMIDLYSSIDYLRLLKGGDTKKLQPIKKRFKKFLQNNPNISAFAEGVTLESLYSLINLNRKKSTPPKEVKNLKEGVNWFDYQEYTLSLCCAEIVEDSKASDGISARMRGNQKEWGFQLNMINFPKGKWEIYANVKIELNSDSSLIDQVKMALFYGIYPTASKGGSIIGQFKNNIYRSVKIGSIDSKNSNAKTVWISPPNNLAVKYLYLDRFFIVKSKSR